MTWLLRAAPLLCLAALPAQEGNSVALTGRAQRRAACKNEPVQQAVRLGLGWLISHQDENGRFSCAHFAEHDPPGKQCDGEGNPAHDIGTTGMVLLALLAGAEPGHTESARTAADWLVSQLHEKSGRFATSSHDFIYAQAIATHALIEAHGIFGGSKYGTAASHGLRYLESHRNPNAAWRYQPHDGENDTSVTAWCIAAFCAATHADLACSPDAVAEALTWLETASNPTNGWVGYTIPDELSARMPADHSINFPAQLGVGLTGAALHARAAVLWPANDPLLALGHAAVLSKPPTLNPKSRDFYSWFHASTALAAADPSKAQTWQKDLQPTLLKLQRKDAAYQGSWNPDDVWGEPSGRVCSTALALLSLAAPWRQGADKLELILPDAAPFRGAYAKWKVGQVGAALAAIDDVLANNPTPEQRAIANRARWFAKVQVRAGQLFAEHNAKLYKDAGLRLVRAEQLVLAFGNDPAFAAVRKVRDDLKAVPGVQEAMNAARDVEQLLATFDTRNPPKESSKRRALLTKFRKLLERHGKTPSAELIQKWVKYFDS